MFFEKQRILVIRTLIFLGYARVSFGKGDQQNWQQQGWNNEGGGQTKGPLGGWDDEVMNPWVPDPTGWKLEDSIPGVPGQSYPNYDKIPDTSFDCRRQKDPGYYGDVESQCQVFHICQVGGRQNSFLCPVGTIFNQETFVCDWWFNVNCGESSTHYGRNGNLYRGSDIGIDGSNVGNVRRQDNSKGSDQLPAVGIPTWGPPSASDGWGMKGNMGQQNPGGQQINNKGSGDPSGNRRRMGGQSKGYSENSRTDNRWHNSGQAIALNQGGGNRWQGGENVNIPNQGGGINTWQNGGHSNLPHQGRDKGWQSGGGNANAPHLGNGQKGLKMDVNVNSGWGPQGNLQGQPGRSSKGMAANQRRVGGNVRNNQKGEMGTGNRNLQGRNDFSRNNRSGGRRQKGQAGGSMRTENVGKGNRRMKGSSRRTESNSFSANRWSMGSQHFQFSSQQKGDGLGNDPNANTEGNRDSSFQEQSQWQGRGFNDKDISQNIGHLKGEDGSNNWNNAGRSQEQWSGNVANDRLPPQMQNRLGNNHNFGGHDTWKDDYDYSNGNSFHFKDYSSNEGQADENDYDYVFNS